jgi:hypothetical protein
MPVTRAARSLAICLMMLVVVAMATVWARPTQESERQSVVKDQFIDWRIAVSGMPSEPMNDSDRALRRQRSDAFDAKDNTKRPLDDPDAREVHEGSDIYYTKTDPLPSSLSDVVVLGTVASFQPYFSNDKTAIYTELQVHVERVLKDKPAVVTGDIAIDMLGGAIRLPNGKIAKQFPAPADSDIQVGRRYVLFLTYFETTRDFRVVKAWELTGGHAQNVAKTDVKDVLAGKSKYHGMSEAEFLHAVQESVVPGSK